MKLKPKPKLSQADLTKLVDNLGRDYEKACNTVKDGDGLKVKAYNLISEAVAKYGITEGKRRYLKGDNYTLTFTTPDAPLVVNYEKFIALYTEKVKGDKARTAKLKQLLEVIVPRLIVADPKKLEDLLHSDKLMRSIYSAAISEGKPSAARIHVGRVKKGKL